MLGMHFVLREVECRVWRPTFQLAPLNRAVTLKHWVEWAIFIDIFVNGAYDAAIWSAVDRHGEERPLVVVDLGANIGLFSLRCLQQTAARRPSLKVKLLCVEGTPSTFSRLRQNLFCGAQTKDLNASLVWGLVGRREGSAQIYAGCFHGANSIFEPTGITRRLRRVARTVSFVNLDSLLENDTVIDLLKCDIEGSEMEFLETYPSLLERVRVFVVEYHTDRVSLDHCNDLVLARGFQKGRVLSSEGKFSVWLYTRD